MGYNELFHRRHMTADIDFKDFVEKVGGIDHVGHQKGFMVNYVPHQKKLRK